MDGTEPEQMEQTGEEQTPTDGGEGKKRIRGPNKAPTDFLGGMRALATQHRAKLARAVEKRDKARATWEAAERELLEAEGPLREVESILERYPELPLESASGLVGVPPAPGEPPPSPDAPDPSKPPPTRPDADRPQHPGEPGQPGQPSRQPDGEPPAAG